MWFPRTSPLSRRIVLPANLIAALSLAALCAFLVSRNDRDARRQLDARATSMAMFLQQASSTYISNYDLSALELFAKQAVKDEDFTFAVFLDDGRKPLTTNPSQAAEAASRVVEEAIHDPDGKVIGYVRLGYVTRRIETVLRQRIALSVAGFLAAQLFLTLGLGWIVQRIRSRLSCLFLKLSEASEKTLQEASRVRSASQSVADGASSQETSLAKTTSSLEEMADMIRKMDESAQAAKDTAERAIQSTGSGVEQIGALIQAMSESRASSNEIRKILKSIDEIAFQTNILALNAAVEAARAGEAGAGFAVVADAVRGLAQRSAIAARESEARIEDALAKGKRGDAISANVASSLRDINERVGELSSLVASMASSTHVQSQGIARINGEVSAIGKITQRNTLSANDGARAAEELNDQAFELQDQIASLGSLVNARFETVTGEPRSLPGAPAEALRPLAPRGLEHAGAAE